MHLSIITFLSGATPPGKGKAKQFISTFQTLEPQSPVWKQKSQWKRDAYKKYKVFLSNQESGDYIHFLYKILLKKKKGDRIQFVMLQTQTVEKSIACFGSRSSGFLSSPPRSPPRFLSPETSFESCINTQVLCISWSLQPWEPAGHSPPSVTAALPLALYMFSDGAVRGASVQENTGFTLGGVSNSYRVK